MPDPSEPPLTAKEIAALRAHCFPAHGMKLDRLLAERETLLARIAERDERLMDNARAWDALHEVLNMPGRSTLAAVQALQAVAETAEALLASLGEETALIAALRAAGYLQGKL